MPDDPAGRPVRTNWTASTPVNGEAAPATERAAALPATGIGAGLGSLPNKWAAFVVIAIGIFMSTLDSSIVNISLPTIAGHFHVGLNGTIEWVIIAYLVASASSLLTIGRLADMLGHKPIWISGLIVFTTSSALCGAAPGLPFLVACRALQGFGGALLVGISPAMLLAAFPPSERGRALGLNSLVVQLGITTGPTIGGILTHAISWRAIFYVNVPIGIVAVMLAARILRPAEHHGTARGRFDPAGALLLAVGLAALTLGLSFGREWGWSTPRVIAALTIGAVGLLGMIVVELKITDPILDLSLFKRRVFASASFTQILSFLSLYPVSFLFPFYLEQQRGYSTIEAGFLMTPLPLSIALVTPFSGALSDRIGTRWLAAIGLAIATGGLLLIGSLGAQTPIWLGAVALIVTGVGQGMFNSPNNSAMLGAAPTSRRGVASGILATGRTVGQSISVAIAGAIFASAGAAAAGARLASGADGTQVAALHRTFHHGFQAAFLVCACICAVGVVTSLTRGDA
ncbi:MAG TPA: DHA2 family efflux MFS transporter permease subunit [Thermomicrobiaceae bacterium]|nr:DHA2 family efflux MFS transporter permease subunit [Thermomicrobiaceae bacterium]